VSEENELPEGWIWTTIGEVAETTSGGTPSRQSPEYYNGTIPWVKSGELEDNIILSVEEFITEEGLKSSNAKIFRQGTPLVAMYGATVGKTAILGLDATTNQAICAISPLQNAFISKFIVYWLQAQRQTLIDQSFGGAQPNINQGIIRAFPMPLAPLSEQYRIIAAIEQQFTRLDSAVTALKHAKAKLKRYRASVLKAAVEGKLTEAWRAEHPATEPANVLLERILVERRAKWEADMRTKGKDPAKVKYVEPAMPDVGDLPGLPEGWCWATLNNLSWHVTSGSRGWAQYYAASGSLFVRVGNFNRLDTKIDLKNVVYVRAPDNLEADRCRLQQGDLLITITADVGMVGIVDEDVLQWGEAFINQHVGLVRFIDPSLTVFAALALASEPLQAQIRNKQYGATKTGLNLEDLKAFVIPLPSISEQQEIISEVERRLSIVTQSEAIVNANLKRAERLRQSILKEAFAGRLVPQDQNDEPASVLLERIHKEREGQKQGPIKKARATKAISAPRMPDVEPMEIDASEMEQMDLWANAHG
jgi:type I restriction enzyme, S subunit